MRYRSNTPSSTCCAKVRRDVRTMTLRGLISRCTNPPSTNPMRATRSNRSRPMRAATSGDTRPAPSTASVRRTRSSVTPSTHSMTMHGTPTTWPRPNRRGKTLQARKLRVAFILALKRRPGSANAARMLLVRFRTMTLRVGQKLQRHVLALRVARMLHAPRAAAVAFAFQHEQRDETTPIRRAIGISQHKRRLETLNARDAHSRRGRRNRKRPCSRIATARISTPPAHKLILASTSLSWAAVTLLPFASWSFQMESSPSGGVRIRQVEVPRVVIRCKRLVKRNIGTLQVAFLIDPARPLGTVVVA